jgi:hypothetical protein
MKELVEEYVKVFGEEPNIIGIYWNNFDRLEENISNAIKTKKPYNELDLLTDEEIKLFNKGKLMF